MRNVNVNSEAGAQEAVFNWIEWNAYRLPELKLAYHIPNGGKRDRAEAAHLKRQGVRAGVPDICLPVARGGYHGLYIELKVGKNKQTKLQIEWQQKLIEQGYKSVVCYGWEETVTCLQKYLQL